MEQGFILINKPVGWTSFDVVGYLRKVTKIKKIGHAGTLDPFATGLLIVGVGREATKRLDEFKMLAKTYVATIRLGATSDTGDRTGAITTHDSRSTTQIDENAVSQILNKFIGKQLQTPPMYSAKKVGGKKLYKLARKGIQVERKPSEIEIYNINLIAYEFPILKIEVSCSTGTYIRTLAEDIGKTIGCGAYCEELERTAIGDYLLKDAINPKMYTPENVDKKP